MDPHVVEPYVFASDFQIFTTVMFGCLLFNAGITVSVMSVVRYIHVKFPFQQIKMTWIVIFLFLNIVYSFSVWMYSVLCCGRPGFLSIVQGAWGDVDEFNSWFLFTMMFPIYAIDIIAMVTSVLTVYELHKISANSMIPVHRKSCNTILMMNCMNFVWFLLTLLNHIIFSVYPVTEDTLEFYEEHYQWLYLQFIVVCFMPAVISAVNPMIVTFRSSKIRKMTKEWMQSMSSVNVPHKY